MESIELKLTAAELQVIGSALGEIPHKFAAPVLETLNRQIAEYAKKKEADNYEKKIEEAR